MPTLAPPKYEQLGRYRILDELGHGAVGLVYRAEDTLIERVVALKTVPRPGPTSPSHEHESFARFLREARASGKLTHPNVVVIFDVGEDLAAGVSFIAMELVEGETLDRVLRRRERIDFERIRAIGMQVASALDAAHSIGVVHRDIKPANLILMPCGRVKVTDFGIAKIVNASMTQDGSLLGSPSYMSPEQVRATEVDQRSDIFSLGIVLYELTTMKPAFPGKNVYDVISRVASGEVRRPSEIRPDMPEALERVILRAMAKDRDERFQSAEEMLRALVAAGPAPAAEVAAVAATAAARTTLDSEVTAQPPLRQDEPETTPATATAASPDTVETIHGSASMAARGATSVTPSSPGRGTWLAAAAVGGLLAAGALWWHGSGSGSGGGANESVPSEAPAATMSLLSECDRALMTTRLDGAPGGSSPATEIRSSSASASASRRATPTPAKAERMEPAPVSQPQPEAPAPVPASPEESAVAAEHDHRLGSCRGELRFLPDRVVYDSADRDKDDRDWSAADLRSMEIVGDTAELAANEGGEVRRYRFRLKSSPDPGVIAKLRERIASAPLP